MVRKTHPVNNEQEQDENVVTPIVDDGIPEGREDTAGMLTKLSMAGIGCYPEASKIDGPDPELRGKEVPQCVVFGQLTGLTGRKELPNAKSEDEKYTFGLVGKIEAINLRTGETFRAGVLYLPAGFHDMFLSEMQSNLDTIAKGGFDIKFALEFSSIPAKNPRGYSWKARNKLPMERHDPLLALRRRALAGSTLKIAPPTLDGESAA